jgi:thiol-disulfide isomerase/thioredoxin
MNAPSLMKRNYTLLFVLAVVAVFYLWRYRSAPDIPLATISITTSDGKTDNLLNALEDSSVVVCYASWCGPCLKELRWLKEAYPTLHQAGIHFYCLSDDSAEKMDVMRANMPAGIEFIHVESLKELGIFTIPATFFIYKKNIIDKQLDAIDWREHQQIINRFNS